MELKSKSVFERSMSFTSFQNFVIVFVTFSVPPVGLKTILYLFILYFLTSDLIYFSFTPNPLPQIMTSRQPSPHGSVASAWCRVCSQIRARSRELVKVRFFPKTHRFLLLSVLGNRSKTLLLPIICSPTDLSTASRLCSEEISPKSHRLHIPIGEVNTVHCMSGSPCLIYGFCLQWLLFNLQCSLFDIFGSYYLAYQVSSF